MYGNGMVAIASDPIPALPHISFFGDASSRDNTYMVAGGLAVAGNRITEIEDAIAALRDDAGIKSEFHWSAYRGGKRREGYENLVKYAFQLINERKAALHIIIAKFDGFDHKAKEGENKDTSVNKMYFQMLLHRVARYLVRSGQSMFVWMLETILATFANCGVLCAQRPIRPTKQCRIACDLLSPFAQSVSA